MDINYWGAVHMTFHALAHLKKRHGKIVVISSITGTWYSWTIYYIYVTYFIDVKRRSDLTLSLLGKLGVPHRTAYAPTKFALHGTKNRFDDYRWIQLTSFSSGFFDSLRLEIGQDVQITLICPGEFLLQFAACFRLTNEAAGKIPSFYNFYYYLLQLIVFPV